MKNNKLTSFILIGGLVIVVAFTSVITINLMPNYESNSYYVKVNDKMDAKVEGLEIVNGKLFIETSGDAVEYCVKTTRTLPNETALWWNKIINNKASIPIYEHKKYYVWIKDKNKEIRSPLSINTKKK